MNTQKAIDIEIDALKGNINRMCVTHDLAELDSMALHAVNRIKKIQQYRYEQLKNYELLSDIMKE